MELQVWPGTLHVFPPSRWSLGRPGLGRRVSSCPPAQPLQKVDSTVPPACPAMPPSRPTTPCQRKKKREPKNGIESQLGPSMLLSRCIYDNALLLNSPEECVIFKLYFSSSLSHSHISSSSLLSCPVFVPFVFLLRKESLLYEQVCEMPGGCGDPQMVRVVPTQ